MASGLDPLPPCLESLTSGPFETTPRIERSLLVNPRRDLFEADGHKESLRLRIIDARISEK